VTASGIQVRPIRIRDLVRLRSMRTDALMPDQPHGPLGPRMPDVRSAMPVTRRGRKSFVAVADGSVAGVIDLVSDPPNHRWVLSRMLTSRFLDNDRSGGSREMVWRELVLEAIRAAGSARAKRIHAVLPEESQVIPAVVSTGFTEYAHDTVLSAAPAPELKPAGVVRRQDPSDVWAIHQLYHQVTPRPVQYAEALTSNFWSRVVPGKHVVRGYVVEDGLEVVAHCRVAEGCDGPVLHVMVHPDALDLIAPVIRDVVVDLHASPRKRISVVVPDYLQEYISILETLGFAETGRQTRLVKYTVVAQRMQFRSVEELANEVPERVAAGTPTLSYAPSGEPRKTHDMSCKQGDHGIS
jgi:hypothetical protein